MSRPFKLIRDNFVRTGKKISWKDSVGCYAIFQNVKNGIEYEVEIYSFVSSKFIEVRYNEKIKKMDSSNFLQGAISELVGIITFEFKYKIGSIIKVKNTNFKILKQIRLPSDNSKGYEVECLECGEISIKQESDLKSYGCKFCANKEITDNNNALVVYPHLQRYVNPEDLKLLAPRSNKFILAKCDVCGFEKSMKVYHLASYGFSCPRCSDGISIPEKFYINLFDCLGINYKYQYSAKWSNRKVYDFYLVDYNILVEVDGDFHFKSTTMSDVKDVIKNDKYKKELALKNGISKYINIDARKSEFEYLKSECLSELQYLFNFNKIDWNDIWVKCQKSIFVEAYTMWNNGNKNIKSISNKLKLHKNTIIRYLKEASNLNLCSYLEDEKVITCSKTVYQYDLNFNLIEKYKSATEASRITNIPQGSISSCCNKNIPTKTSHGFIWSYEELDKNSIDLNNKNHRTVYQYSEDLILINEFKSIADASRFSDVSPKSIQSTCSGRTKKSGGFIWSYEELSENEKIKMLSNLNRADGKTLYQYDKSLKLLAIYDSVTLASKSLGINRRTLSDSANGVYKNPKHGFIFSYIPLHES